MWTQGYFELAWKSWIILEKVDTFKETETCYAHLSGNSKNTRTLFGNDSIIVHS